MKPGQEMSASDLKSEAAPTAMTAQSHVASAFEELSMSDTDSEDEEDRFEVMSAESDSENDDELERQSAKTLVTQK